MNLRGANSKNLQLMPYPQTYNCYNPFLLQESNYCSTECLFRKYLKSSDMIFFKIVIIIYIIYLDL